MSKYDLKSFQIKSESENKKGIKVTDLEVPERPVIKDFQFDPLVQNTQKDYNSVRKKFGPLAATDIGRAARVQKDRRFSLNPLLKEPLSIEQEEARVLEEKVKEKISQIQKETQANATVEGYKEGWKSGYADAIKKFQEEGNSFLGQFKSVIEELENAKIEIFKENEQFLIEIMYRIAKKVILRELTTDSEYIVRLSKELINSVGSKSNITVRISQDDAKNIEKLNSELIKEFGELKNLKIEVSSQVAMGGCRIETEWDAIYASLDKQLEGIYSALAGTDAKMGES